MKRCIFPGSFDPITIGHYDIINRSLLVFDEVIVAVLVNTAKQPLFSQEERVELIKTCFRGNPKIRVICDSGLLVELAKRENTNIIIRGLRDSSDFEREKQAAHVNSRLGDLETVFFATKPEFQCISSSVVRELLRFEKNLTGFVPDKIEVLISELWGKKNG